MRVVLFRHGPAGSRDPERWPDDSARPLTSSGARLTRAVASGLARIEGNVGTIASSPFVRAWQTARVVADVMEVGVVEELDALRPGGTHEDVIAFLSAHASDRTVVLVGHEPDLGEFAGSLACGPPVALALKKAGACAIRFEGRPAVGEGRLSWMMGPRLLRRMSAKKIRR